MAKKTGKKQMNFWFTELIYNFLKKESYETGKPMNGIVSEVLTEKIEETTGEETSI